MLKKIHLRPARIQDAEVLLEWRNDPETRAASHNSEEVKKEEHISWVKKVLADKKRRLFIAEEDGRPFGTIRVDFSDGVYKLSWTVAPNSRGRGLGKEMVKLIANQITDGIRAEIKMGNQASVRIAEYAGMIFEEEKNGVLHYRRQSLHRFT
jgi:RimJ/RimL family protein N-acetyltransferase